MSLSDEIRLAEDGELLSKLKRFEHHAMHTIFEIFIDHPDLVYAEQAAQAAFAELDRLEEELSRFLPNSEISRINAMKQHETIIISEDTFNCIEACLNLYQLTKGAFDISAGPLINLWKTHAQDQKKKNHPDNDTIQRTLKMTGVPWLQLDPERKALTLNSESIFLDLGGYGKGYALKQMERILQEWDIMHALLHSGFSTVAAYSKGSKISWPLAIRLPSEMGLQTVKINLCNQSVSSSGMVKGIHIIDPRTGYPAEGGKTSWVITDRPDYADALSTALLLMKEEEFNSICAHQDELSAVLVKESEHEPSGFSLVEFGGFDFL